MPNAIGAKQPRDIFLLIMFCLGAVILSKGVVRCKGPIVGDRAGRKQMAKRTIEEVLGRHAGRLMSISGVVGTGQGIDGGRSCIKVYVVTKTPSLNRKIPETIEGYPVVVEETGEIRALPEDQD